MGFIDYHGIKEERYTEVLEYARAQQEEDWKRKDEKKLTLWLRNLTGNGNYAQLYAEDLIKYIVVKYRTMQKTWNALTGLMKSDSQVNEDQLWKDFSLDLAARHLSVFPLNHDRGVRYQQAFQTKIFKLEGAVSAQEHYQYIAENAKYRRYFAECFDPTWKGQHLYKWLFAGVKKNPDGKKPIDDFLDAERDLCLFLALYLHQVILPHDDAWMREAETERKALADIRGKIHRGTFFAPDKTLLVNPLFMASTETTVNSVQTAAMHEQEAEAEAVAKGPKASIPGSGLDKKRFQELLERGSISDYVVASEMITACALPGEIAQTFRQLIERMPILQDAVNRFDGIYHADLDQFEDYFAPEALKITAVYLDYQAVRLSEKILKETRESVFLATRKLLQVVNEKIDEIYRFVTIDANAEAKALETLMSQDGHVDPAHRIK